jgi:DNA replication protein DnaC
MKTSEVNKHIFFLIIKKTKKMNTQSTLEQLQQLKLSGMAHAYQGLLAMPVHDQLSMHEAIARLAHAELQSRNHYKTQMYLKLSKLRYNAALEQIICSPQRNFTKEQLALLSDCSFIHRAENILITGATGCGKSYLACAIGRQACIMGYRVLYIGMTRFLEKITQVKLEGSYVKMLNQMERNHLIVLDDFGLHPMDNNIKLALLQLLEDRFEKKPVIITSQLPIEKWYEYLNEPTLADAIMDRLSASAHRIELKGESLRIMKNQK